MKRLMIVTVLALAGCGPNTGTPPKNALIVGKKADAQYVIIYRHNNEAASLQYSVMVTREVWERAQIGETWKPLPSERPTEDAP